PTSASNSLGSVLDEIADSRGISRKPLSIAVLIRSGSDLRSSTRRSNPYLLSSVTSAPGASIAVGSQSRYLRSSPRLRRRLRSRRTIGSMTVLPALGRDPATALSGGLFRALGVVQDFSSSPGTGATERSSRKTSEAPEPPIKFTTRRSRYAPLRLTGRRDEARSTRA